MTDVDKENLVLPQDLQITFARPEDEEQLASILAEYGMGIPGSIEEQLIVKARGQVLAGAKVKQISDDRFFLEVIGVRSDYLANGIGRLLLERILKNPWQSCRRPRHESQPKRSYQITTLARGGASEFYRKMGFLPCGMEELPEENQEQCDTCPDRENCYPMPMVYSGNTGS